MQKHGSCHFIGMEQSDSTYLSALEIKAYNKALYKFSCLLSFTHFDCIVLTTFHWELNIFLYRSSPSNN